MRSLVLAAETGHRHNRFKVTDDPLDHIRFLAVLWNFLEQRRRAGRRLEQAQGPPFEAVGQTSLHGRYD